MTKNIIHYRNVMFSENVFAFFRTSDDKGEYIDPPIIGKELVDVFLKDSYYYDEQDPNPDGSFPVYEDSVYVGRIFCPVA
jgi:hypothetical protein